MLGGVDELLDLVHGAPDFEEQSMFRVPVLAVVHTPEVNHKICP